MQQIISMLVFLFTLTTLASLAVSLNDQGSSGDDIMLESFASPRHRWKEMNDPIMGGRSTGTFAIQDQVGVFAGNVVNVPFLHAPGFIQARTTDSQPFPDISMCQAFRIQLQSYTDYAGLRFSFGDAHPPHGKRFAYGYKTNVHIPTNEWVEWVVPVSNFTDYWDDATGDAIVTCQDDSRYCPTREALQNLKTMAIWGEGVEGQVHVEIKSIYATQCASEQKKSVDNEEETSGFAQLLAASIFQGWKNQVSLPGHLLDLLF